MKDWQQEQAGRTEQQSPCLGQAPRICSVEEHVAHWAGLS